MPRKFEITTLRSTVCSERHTCPGVHTISDRPGRKYVVLKRVSDPDELAAFAHLMADDEILGHDDGILFPEM